MNWQSLHTRLLLRNVKRHKPAGGFDRGKISAPFIVADLVNRFSGSRSVWWIGGLFRDSPVRFVRLFEEVLEEILEKRNTAREFNIDVAVVLEDEPWNVRHNALVFRLSPPMLKISLNFR
jgi:hypothetical protein